MSSTFSELAATALIEKLVAQPESGRHVVTSTHGEDLLETFRTVLARAEGVRNFKVGQGEPVPLRVFDNGDGCIVVPYFVEERLLTKPRENRGSQGFLSALRDVYNSVAAVGERIILLAFDASPNETILTTMDEGVAEVAIRLEQLLLLALRPPDDSSQALRRTLTELERLAQEHLIDRLDTNAVGRTAQAVTELGHLERTNDVATELYQIPWCLSDPRLFEHAGREFQRRLEIAIKYRAQLSEWATNPSTDFESEVRKTFDPAASRKIVEARVGTDIDWSKFTLDDLTAGAPPPPEDNQFPQFAEMPVEVEEATALKLLSSSRTVAVQIPGPGCSIKFNLTRPLVGDTTIHVVGYSGAEPPYSESKIGEVTAATGEKLVIGNLPQPRPGWSFVEAVLTKGKRMVKTPLDSLRLAINVGGEPTFLVYESSGVIDLESQAYSGDEGLTFIAERDGEEIWAEDVEPPNPEDFEFGELVTLRGNISAPVVQTAVDGGSVDETRTESAEHLAIEKWKSGVLPPGPLHASLRRRPNGIVVADIGPVSMPLVGSSSIPVSRWDLERYLIHSPRVTAIQVSNTGTLSANDEVDRLALGDLSAAFDEFLLAREAFFAELADLSVVSVLSADLTASQAAQSYVDTYARLLNDIPDGQPSHLGYDKILLVDSIITSSGELLIAPTSPLAVAQHMQLQLKTQDWLGSEPASNYFRGDVSLISTQYLVPYLRLHTMAGRWLESGYAPYPWRRYLPFSERDRQERHPTLHRYIARRIERFLDVHPSYADERRSLRIAFVNPGGAAHIRDALLFLVEPYLKKQRGAALKSLPAFDLQLLSDKADATELVGAELDLFMGFTPEEGQPTDAAMEVMKRLSYTKGSVSEFMQDPKSFAHITFLEDFFQPQPDLLEWMADAHPSSMYVSGLAADTERLAKIEPAATRFLRATWTGGQTNETVTRIAARTTEVSAAAAGVPVKRGVVRAADVLVPDSQIPQLYDRSAWVVHIDRYVGLELFAPQDVGSNAPYILDYTDQETPEPGIFDGITATSQVGPYRAQIAEVLGGAVQIGDQGIAVDAADRLLRTLNLISGRWGLEMLSTEANVLRGRLATALAAQVLEQVESLHRDPTVLTLIVSLDELLRVTGGERLPLSEGWAAKAGKKGKFSDDLLLLTVPLASGRPQLRGRIVEVKYRTGPGTSIETAAEQLKATHALLSELLVGEEQPGREFQGRHLAKLILRYASRHVAYGLKSGQPVLKSGAEALSRIAAGEYDLDLNLHRSGKVLVGDYISVEPGLDDAFLAPQIASVAGTEIGRIRIGGPVIAAMLRTGRVPGLPDLSGQTSGITSPEVKDVPSESEGTTALSAGMGAKAEEKSHESESSSGHPDLKKVQSSGSSSRFDLPISELRGLGSRLDDVLTSYNLPLQPVQPTDAVCGPNTIRFRVRMARGGTIAQIEARERDIMRELGLEKPIMIGQEAGFVCLDVPRDNPITVTFGDLAPELVRIGRTRGELPVIFGVDLAGVPHIEDLAQLPHLLVAGSTNSGKSVFLSSLLGSLAMLPPSELEIVLIDVKGLDFAPFAKLPHLRRGLIGNAVEALHVLDHLYEDERTKRQKILTAAGAQSILDYFTRVGGKDLTQIVIVIDEFSNLLGGDKTTGSQLEDTIQQYAEIMRSFGVYLVIATQRPSADIVTGRIKSNLPARCALRLPTHSDSMTILGRKGAEQLLGRGDMLFYRDGRVERLQAPFTTAQDVIAAAHE